MNYPAMTQPLLAKGNNNYISFLVVAREVTLRTHTVNGVQVEMSSHPFTDENSQLSPIKVSH